MDTIDNIPVSAPKLSIIICSYNRERHIGVAIESLLQQGSAILSQCEIILVDNKSTDGTGQLMQDAIAKARPSVHMRYYLETNQGLSFARNRGIAESTGALVTFMDDDAIAAPRFLQEIIQFFDQHPEVGAMGGKVLPKFVDGEPQWMSRWVRKVASEVNYGEGEHEMTGRRYPFGANMSMRRSMLDRYGLFNTQLGRTGTQLLGGEEKDLFDRLRAGGEQIYYCGRVVVDHIIEASRLTEDYIRRFCIGVGYSERIRMKDKPNWVRAKKSISQYIKLLGAWVLRLLYTLKGEASKGKMITDVAEWLVAGWRGKRP